MAQPQSQSRVGQARHVFFERGGIPAGGVPGTILDSWRRCQRMGVAAEPGTALEPLPVPRLRELRERHQSLWRLARAELDGLSADVAAAGSIVLLTDADGWILDAEGSPRFLDKAGRVALMPGVCWSEAQVGTNAIGTAIAEGRAIEVRGGEHYRSPHGILSCFAAPVHDPYGQLVGVLDLSGEASVQHLHALGLIRRAVASIERRWFEAGIPDAQLLRVHHDPALLGTAREGLLAFRNGRLVAANQAGLALFGLERGEIGRAPYAALFDAPPSRLHDDGVLVDRHGRVLHGRLDETAATSRMVAPARNGSAPATAPRTHAGREAPLFDARQQAELDRARRVLDAGLPVLVLGETGTGKEVFARELHRRCQRAGKPFIAVNCAALPEGLIEAELFGYEDGAFTGARKHGNPGLLRQANGGVLFLDEIGDMPPALQPRLLRVLQERELSPLGGGKPVKLDFALVCATHRNLDAAIAEGRFRADLYYRIAHHIAMLPPLRDHPDRAGLVRELWQAIGDGRRLDAAALARLAEHDWPGNLRQLVACLRTLVALSDPGQTLGLEQLPGWLRTATVRPAAVATPLPGVMPPVEGGLDAVAVATMRQALADCGGNVSRAARVLGISRSTLYRRLGLGG